MDKKPIVELKTDLPPALAGNEQPPSRKSNPRPAYLEDYDEKSGRTVKGSRRIAKEKPQDKKQLSSEKSKRKPEINYPSQRKDRPVIITERDVKNERRKSTASFSQRDSNKQPSYLYNDNQVEKETDYDRRHFGILSARPAPPILLQNIIHPIPIRPRAVTSNDYPRLSSFYSAHNYLGGYGPPLSTSAWANYSPAPQYAYAPSPSHIINPYPQMATPTRPLGSDYFSSQAMVSPSERYLRGHYPPDSKHRHLGQHQALA